MNIDLCLIIGIIIICILLSYLYAKNTKEYFEDKSADLVNQEMAAKLENQDTKENHQQNNDVEVDGEGNFVNRDDIQNVAREIAHQYCPVSPEYNPANYVKKSEIDLQTACPKLPNLKDYVLKSTIPPVQKCPSCVCPKIKLEAGLCKECPTPKNNCPKPQPCNVEQCRNVIKCEPWQKQVSCPKCPPPEPCPQLPHKVCPALTLPKNDFKCPETKPCPIPNQCKDGKGRCPDNKCPKCVFKGVDTVVREKTSAQIINELLDSEDPRMKELLEKLKNRLDLNQSSSPSDLDSMRNDLGKLLSVTEKVVPTFEAAPTNPSNNLTLKHRVMSNNELKGNQNSPSSNNNESYFRVKHIPKAFDSSCQGDHCPYDTNLPI